MKMGMMIMPHNLCRTCLRYWRRTTSGHQCTLTIVSDTFVPPCCDSKFALAAAAWSIYSTNAFMVSEVVDLENSGMRMSRYCPIFFEHLSDLFFVRIKRQPGDIYRDVVHGFLRDDRFISRSFFLAVVSCTLPFRAVYGVPN